MDTISTAVVAAAVAVAVLTAVLLAVGWWLRTPPEAWPSVDEEDEPSAPLVA